MSILNSYSWGNLRLGNIEIVKLVLNKLDIPIKLDIEKRIEGARLVGDHKTTTLQDYQSKKPHEIDALTKSLIELGELTGISTPTIKTIYNLAKYFAIKNSCYPEWRVSLIP